MNKTLSEIQSELKVWTEYNFGKQDSSIPILGMIEELGELSHAILKEKQGIRQSDFLADKKDAIADIVIYVLNYFNSINKTVVFETQSNDFTSKTEHLISFIVTRQIGRLTATVYTRKGYTDTALSSCRIILRWLDSYSSFLGFDFTTLVNEVWEQVKLRDWKKYPKDGRTN